ncbi:hypothetical protein FQR65_LT04378 [Abscondita terminalis]|nr:hypothetical protein FQR65_LT04378 [Abscondita terminalis]
MVTLLLISIYVLTRPKANKGNKTTSYEPTKPFGTSKPSEELSSIRPPTSTEHSSTRSSTESLTSLVVLISTTPSSTSSHFSVTHPLTVEKQIISDTTTEELMWDNTMYGDDNFHKWKIITLKIN